MAPIISPLSTGCEIQGHDWPQADQLNSQPGQSIERNLGKFMSLVLGGITISERRFSPWNCNND